ncbi:MAG: hypothetical protein K8R74_04500 [Bacteroidales bacterium]|nr:hypothetical protein [Bacteroidales bacterium]
MKKTMKHILALVIILPFLFAGCQKSETIEAEKSSDTGFHKTSLEIEYCGDPYIANLVDYEQTITAGIVTVGNDETMLYVTFEAAADWNFSSTILYVGPAEDVPGSLLPDGTGQFSPWLFPYSQGHPPGTQEYTFSFDLNDFDSCFIVVAYADVVNTSTGEDFIVWGKSNLKTWGFYFEYCKQDCEIPQYDCETAYAYGDDLATCFLDIPELKTNNWGWSNGPISDPSSYSWDIYAGAGQCDITKGTLVGTLDVDYSAGTVIVTYNIDPDFTMDENHLFIGENGEMLPRKKGKYTTAPGQFPYSGQSSYTIDGLSGDIYVVAHSVVCGDYDE